MASPVKEAKAYHQSRGFDQVIVRGKGSLYSRNPALGRVSLVHQVGGLGWHFGDGPFTEAHEVDTAWVDAHPIDDAPWQKKMVLADYHAYFGPGYTNFRSDQLIKYVHPSSGESVDLQPMGLYFTNDLDDEQLISMPTEGAVSIADDMLTWANAYGTDIDFQWQTQTARLMKYVNIANLAALGTPEPYIIAGGNPALRVQLIFQKSAGIEIWVDGVEWNENPNNPQETINHVEFRLASTGEVVWNFKSPAAWDSHDTELEGRSQIAPLMRLRKTGPNLFVEILTPWSWLETATYPVTIDVTVDEDVVASSDDSWETSTGLNVIDAVSIVVNETDEWLGLRWLSVTLANVDTIDVAYISVYIYSTNFDSPSPNITFEDSVAPATFSAGGVGTYDISGRTDTTALVNWDPGNNIGVGWHNTDSIVSIIEELEASYDYSGGEPMAALWVDDGAQNSIGIYAYDQDSQYGALLYIEYTEVGGVDITVPVAALTLTGYAPTVEVTENINIEIPVAALSLTGYVPAVATPVDVEIPVAALALTGYAPTVAVTENVNIEVPVAALTLTGYIPTIEATANVDVEIPVAALTLTGYAPVVTTTANIDIEVPVTALTLTGYAPEIQAGESIEVVVPVAALTLTGYAPTVEATAHVDIEIPVAALTLTGFAPTATVTGDIDIEIPAATMTLTGYAPAIAVTANVDITIPVAALTLTGYVPSVSVLVIVAIRELQLHTRTVELFLEDRSVDLELHTRSVDLILEDL